MAKIKLGTTLYSFTNEQRDCSWTTEDCFREIAGLGLEGVEIVASQTFDNYPWPTEKQIYAVRDLAEKYGLEIAAYSAQADRGKRTDIQDLSEDDMFTYALNDIKYAYKIGAKAQRQQCQIYPNVMRRLAPWAEAYGIKIGVEMHSPMVPREAGVEAFQKVFDEIDSPYIGWTPDFGMFDTQEFPAVSRSKAPGDSMMKMRKMYPSRANIPSAACDFFEAKFDELDAPDMLAALKANFHLTQRQMADIAVLYAGRDAATPEQRSTIWEDFETITLPRAIHFHGKFNQIGKDGDDISIHTSRILDIIRRSDYSGYISIEYEGHGRFPDVPVTPILREHVAFYHKLLGL